MCLTPINANSLAQVTKRYFDGHFCVKDLLFQSNVNSEGLDMADGILGLSPGNYGRHSLLPELKIAGLIDRTIVSFSNAHFLGSRNYNASHDAGSYVIFGGMNET